MNIIYCSKNDTSSNIMAAVHLKYIKSKNEITDEKLSSLINNKKAKIYHKKLIFKGTDEFSNNIFTIDAEKDCEILMKLIRNYLKLQKGSKKTEVINTPKLSTFKTLIGRYLINIGIKNLGQNLLKNHIKNNLNKFIDKYRETKKLLQLD